MQTTAQQAIDGIQQITAHDIPDSPSPLTPTELKQFCAANHLNYKKFRKNLAEVRGLHHPVTPSLYPNPVYHYPSY